MSKIFFVQHDICLGRRFDSVSDRETQVHMDLSYIDPQSKVFFLTTVENDQSNHNQRCTLPGISVSMKDRAQETCACEFYS